MFQYPQRVDLRWNQVFDQLLREVEAVSIPSTGRFTLELLQLNVSTATNRTFQYPQRVDLRWNDYEYERG